MSNPEGMLAKSYGHSDATYLYKTFKVELVDSIVARLLGAHQMGAPDGYRRGTRDGISPCLPFASTSHAR